MTSAYHKVSTHSHTFIKDGKYYIVSYETPTQVNVDMVTEINLGYSLGVVVKATQTLERLASYRVPLQSWSSFTSAVAIHYLGRCLDGIQLGNLPLGKSYSNYIPKHNYIDSYIKETEITE
jgi:hypothetical protein